MQHVSATVQKTTPNSNWDHFLNFFSEADFMPHGHCYLWKPELVWTHVISDLLIGIAYVSISIILYGLVKKTNIGFSKVVLCFGVFIGACGWTHFNEIWNLWYSDYWYSGGIKAITAFASVGTGFYLYKLRHAIYTVAEAAKLSEQRRLDLEVLTEDLEQRVAERTKELNERDQLFHFAQEVAGVGTFEWNIITDENKWTPELEKLYGLPKGTFGGTLEEWSKLVHPEDLKTATAAIQEALDKGTFETQWRVILPDSSVRWLGGRGYVERDLQGKPIRMIGMNIDITKEKKYEQEREANMKKLDEAIKARDTFLSIASHELKTPLTSISLQTQLMKRALLNNNENLYSKDRLDRFVDQNEKHVNRLTRLVDDMLDISKISSGKLTIDKEEFDLCKLVEEVAGHIEGQFTNENIKLHISMCEKAIGNWDKFRIEQVLINLLTNAIKYGRGKPVELHVKKTKDFVTVSISDQGIGIAEENIQRIFGRFERAISASEISGLGLGLFISKEIIHSHKGKIWVESEINKGSTFYFELPLIPISSN